VIELDIRSTSDLRQSINCSLPFWIESGRCSLDVHHEVLQRIQPVGVVAFVANQMRHVLKKRLAVASSTSLSSSSSQVM